MLLSQYFAQNSQRLNATNYPANCAYHLVPPSIQPTAFGGVGEYFGVARAEIPSASYSSDNMGYRLQWTTDPVTGQYKAGLDVYKDTPTGVQFVGSVYPGFSFASAYGVGGAYAFAGKWLGVLYAIDQSDNRAKMLIVNCETMQLNYYPLPDLPYSYGIVGNHVIHIDGEPYIGVVRGGANSQSWSMDFYRCSDGQFFSGVGVSVANACYGEYIISHYSSLSGGGVYATKMRTATYPGYQYPVVEADPALTSSTTTASGNVYNGMLLAPLDGSYVFNDAREGKLFTLDPATAQGSFGPSVNNGIWNGYWGTNYYTGPNHQYPDYILQNGCQGNYGPKAGFFLFNIHDPTPPANGDGSYDITDPYWGRQCATHLMQQSTPATPANLTTIPVKYSGLVSLHRGLVSWNTAENKVEQFGIVDWQRPTTWAEAMASSHCPWFFDAASPVSQIRNDTLFTLEYKVPTTGTSAWVLKNRHPVGLHAPHAVDVAPGTKLRVYALVESDTDLNHGYFMAHDYRNSGTWRNPNDKRASGLYENDYGSGIVFCGQRVSGGSLNTNGIVGALAIDSVIYLNSSSGGLSPVGVTLQAFLDELNTSAIVESESSFFSDWQNRAAKSYVDLTFTVNTTLGYVFVLIEVYKAGVLVTSANFNTYTPWNPYNTDLSSETTFILSIGSACTNQPLVVEPLVTPKPFALRM